MGAYARELKVYPSTGDAAVAGVRKLWSRDRQFSRNCEILVGGAGDLVDDHGGDLPPDGQREIGRRTAGDLPADGVGEVLAGAGESGRWGKTGHGQVGELQFETLPRRNHARGRCAGYVNDRNGAR